MFLWIFVGLVGVESGEGVEDVEGVEHDVSEADVVDEADVVCLVWRGRRRKDGLFEPTFLMSPPQQRYSIHSVDIHPRGKRGR